MHKTNNMTYLKEWAMDPFDIVWKNFMNSNSNYNINNNQAQISIIKRLIHSLQKNCSQQDNFDIQILKKLNLMKSVSHLLSIRQRNIISKLVLDFKSREVDIHERKVFGNSGVSDSNNVSNLLPYDVSLGLHLLN